MEIPAGDRGRGDPAGGRRPHGADVGQDPGDVGARLLDRFDGPVEPVPDVGLVVAPLPAPSRARRRGSPAGRRCAAARSRRLARTAGARSRAPGRGVGGCRIVVESHRLSVASGAVCDNRAMVGRALLSRAEPGFTLPAFERLAPPPPPELVARTARGELRRRATSWPTSTAAAAGSPERRSIASAAPAPWKEPADPAARRGRPPPARPPPPRRRLLGAVRLAARRVEPASSRSATCSRPAARPAAGRSSPTSSSGPPAARRSTAARPVRKHYRCTICRDQQGGAEQRQARARRGGLASGDRGRRSGRRPGALRERFPMPDGGERARRRDPGPAHGSPARGPLGHPRADRGRAAGGPGRVRAPARFLHAILPASRLGAGQGRVPAITDRRRDRPIAGPGSVPRAQPMAGLRGGFRVVPRVRAAARERARSGRSRRGSAVDLRGLVEGAGTAVLRVATAGALERPRPPRHATPFASRAARRPAPDPPRPRPAPAPVQPGAARGGLPRDALGPRARGRRAPPAGAAAGLGDPGALVVAGRRPAPVAGGGRAAHGPRRPGGPAPGARRAGGARRRGAGRVGAGYRLAEARLAEADDEIGGVVELIPPGGVLPPGPRTRGNRRLEPVPGGRGDPELVPGPRPVRAARATSRPGRSRRARPPRPSSRPPSRSSARGASRPATSGSWARSSSAWIGRASCAGSWPLAGDGGRRGDRATSRAARRRGARRRPPTTGARHARRRHGPRAGSPAPRPRRRRPARDRRRGRARRAERPPTRPGRAGPRPRPRRAGPADPAPRSPRSSPAAGGSATGAIARRPRSRSPTASNGPSTASSRPPARSPRRPSSSASPRSSPGHDLPDETLVRACLASYRSPASTAEPARHRRGPPAPDRGAHRAPGPPRERRPPARHARLARAGASRRRRIGDRTLGDFLDQRERKPWFPTISLVPKEDGEAVDCIWYVRGRTGAPVRGRVDGDARRRPAPPPRPDPGRRAPRPLPRHRAGAAPSWPATSSTPHRSCATRWRRRTGTSSSGRTCAPGSSASPLDLAASSRTWASIRPSNGAASSSGCSTGRTRYARPHRPRRVCEARGPRSRRYP